MNEFTQLLESELLNEDTKKALGEAIESFKVEAIAEAKNELEVEYAKKLLAEKETIAKSMYALINEAVTAEVTELKEDIAHYKDIEPKYAEKLEEFKTEYSAKLSESFGALVESTVKGEMVELKEDLMESKKNNFGMVIFEAFKESFEKLGITEDMGALKAKLEESEKNLNESVDRIAQFERDKVMEGLLANLSGSKREVMKTLLESVDTDKLADRYNETIEKVLEDASAKTDADDEVIVENETVTVDKESDDAEIARLRQLIK